MFGKKKKNDELLALKEELNILKNDFNALVKMVKPQPCLYNDRVSLSTILDCRYLRLNYLYEGKIKSIMLLQRPSYFHKIIKETCDSLIIKVADVNTFRYLKVTKENGNITDVSDIYADIIE